jgi:hypothetical protein
MERLFASNLGSIKKLSSFWFISVSSERVFSNTPTFTSLQVLIYAILMIFFPYHLLEPYESKFTRNQTKLGAVDAI